MRFVLYSIFSVSLFLWTTISVKYDVSVPMNGYLMGIVILEILLLLVQLGALRKSNDRVYTGMILAAVLINLGMSVNYRCFDIETENPTIMEDTYLRDLIPMIIGFILVYLAVRFTRIYRYKTVNMIIILMLPISIIGARLTSEPSGGSYLYFAGVMIFGLVLAGYPFAASAYMSSNEERYLCGKVGNISWNQICFLVYNFILYAGCAICNEFGLILVVGLTSTVMFFLWCKDVKSKLFYTIACAGGAVIAGMKVSHLSNRIQIWLNPVEAFLDEELGEKAESLLYLFRHIKGIGWWGNGIGNLSDRIYPTLNTDHALVLLMNDYGVISVIAVIALGILFVRWMLITPKDLCGYDRYLNQGCALIVCFIILIDIASNLGSFITAGIGFPWISDGSSVNLMLTVLMAVHCGLLEKKGEKKQEKMVEKKVEKEVITNA